MLIDIDLCKSRSSKGDESYPARTDGNQGFQARQVSFEN